MMFSIIALGLEIEKHVGNAITSNPAFGGDLGKGEQSYWQLQELTTEERR